MKNPSILSLTVTCLLTLSACQQQAEELSATAEAPGSACAAVRLNTGTRPLHAWPLMFRSSTARSSRLIAAPGRPDNQ